MWNLFRKSFGMMLAVAAMAASPRALLAVGAGIVDNAHILKPDTVTQAQDIVRQIKSREKHDVRVETYPTIPENLKSQFTSEGKEPFFASWAEQIGKENAVTGIVILICMDPGHIQVAVGNATRQHAFTDQDRAQVRASFVAAFKEKNYDAGVLDALRTIEARMAANIGATGTAPVGNTSPGGTSSGGAYSGGSSNSGSPVPNVGQSHGFSIGGMFCLIVGAVLILILIVRMMNRNRGYGGPPGAGYGAPPAGGYPPGYVGGGGYPPPGYQGGGGGGGFGRGLLGGLLGGALGSWGYDKFAHRDQGGASGGYTPTPGQGSAGNNDVDTSYSSTGGDFDASPPDSGGGGDFGSGGDSGGGGGDFGGGGDSGGGGGDSGGGGDF